VSSNKVKTFPLRNEMLLTSYTIFHLHVSFYYSFLSVPSFRIKRATSAEAHVAITLPISEHTKAQPTPKNQIHILSVVYLYEYTPWRRPVIPDVSHINRILCVRVSFLIGPFSLWDMQWMARNRQALSVHDCHVTSNDSPPQLPELAAFKPASAFGKWRHSFWAFG
jgi:hypothetical protein